MRLGWLGAAVRQEPVKENKMNRQSILSCVGKDKGGTTHQIDLLIISQVGLNMKEIQEVFTASDFYLVKDWNPQQPAQPSFKEFGFSANEQRTAVATWLDFSSGLEPII